MESKNIKFRNIFEPWGILICFFLFSALILQIQFKLEDIYRFRFSNEANNAIIGIVMFLLVCFFFFYYMKKFVNLLSMFKFNAGLFVGGFLIQIVVLLLSGFAPYFILMRDFSEFSLTAGNFQMNMLMKMIVPLIIAPMIEEVFFRGILQRLFVEYYSPSFAIIFCGLSFAVIHLAPLPGETHLVFILSFFARWFHGILLSAVTYKTKNLSFAFGFHIANNFLALLMG